MSADVLVDLPIRIKDHYSCFMDLIGLVPTTFYSGEKKQQPQEILNIETADDSSMGEIPTNNTAEETKEDLNHSTVKNKQDNMDFSNFSIVNERMELKNKFNEKLNAHRTKRGAPPISEEDKELVPPGKKIKREEKKS